MNAAFDNIRLTDGQRRYIAARAAQAGVDAGEYLGSLIPSADENGRLQVAPGGAPSENALQVAERLGLVGATSGEPADLATNPVHLEGFGEDASNAR